LKEAYEAFLLSDDPYAYYRIGQAFEEGWLGEVNPETAMKWYEKSANCGHHLALKRLGKSKNSSKI
jgi:TPR repeat protein